MGNNEDLFSKLDDNMLIINNILASKFVDRIKDTVIQRMKKLRFLQDYFDEIVSHQKNWIYL